uniref:Uncharacterized protein n=1 Tax=Meloidogyne incognita TaxID=6306 RepID=A0A914M799_MELIC
MSKPECELSRILMWMVMRMMNFVHFHLGRPFLFQLMGQYHLRFVFQLQHYLR